MLLALASFSTGRAAERKDREFRECPVCPAMVGIPAGRFVMGSGPREQGRFDSEGPRHEVEIRAFALGKYAVTSDEFLAFLRDTGHQPAACNAILDMRWRVDGVGKAAPPYASDLPRWPAICLSWSDAKRYVEWLNAKVGAARPDAARPEGPYRLPSDAELEYDPRARTDT
jgi:formylglycine-generating enzyme required for sulfatase activity